MELGLIDYGMGNLHSVRKALERLGQSLRPVSAPHQLQGCDALILPGVGAFDPAMENLEATGLVPHLKRWGEEQRPILGICLGLQLLFDSSAEGERDGLGLLQGRIERLPVQQGERIPHMGWAPLSWRQSCPLLPPEEPAPWVYFVHSFAAVPSDPKTTAATAPFGATDVTAIVWEGRTGACQFHPEKSSDAGTGLLRRWIEWLSAGAPLLP
ncbi:MAG TPA: imidazole glycerol phosphate synthase subunit HisH [Synechococcus sp. UBA9887]|nr:imidazole glycerol phosphate synthase subunit HisH [Synechococcus sp. UBA9887]